MNVLLDTCTFLWILTEEQQLSAAAADAYRAPGTEVYLSAASAWEIATKHRRGRLPLPYPLTTLLRDRREARGIRTLPLEVDDALQMQRLPPLHNDPFDRMLICQAITHGLAILTPDPDISQYPVRVIW
jgi:PIN domain nuclease of toxin-antitoxin system